MFKLQPTILNCKVLIMSEQFVVIPTRVITDNISDGLLRLLCVLSTFADESGSCYPSVKKLATRCHCTERSVQRNLALLIERGYVTKKS